MVTFRFYVVSAVVFFLALAVGVVVGSALGVGDATRIEEGLNDMEAKLDETVSLIDEKNDQIKELERYENESAPFAGDATLEETASVIVVEPGLDTGVVEDLNVRLGEAGANTLGYVVLSDRWALGGDTDAEDLAALIEFDGSNDDLGAAIWAEVFGVVPPDGSDGSDEGTQVLSDSSATVDLELLAALESAGFVELVGFGNELAAGETVAVVAVTGHDSALAADGKGSALAVTALAPETQPFVLAEITSTADGAPERGATIELIRENSEADFSSVDNLDRVAGRVATVLALAESMAGGTGNYGFGPGTASVLPRWPIQ